MRSDEGETDGDGECETDGGSQGGPDRITGELDVKGQYRNMSHNRLVNARYYTMQLMVPYLLLEWVGQ